MAKFKEYDKVRVIKCDAAPEFLGYEGIITQVLGEYFEDLPGVCCYRVSDLDAIADEDSLALRV